jgi:hypothetical protein
VNEVEGIFIPNEIIPVPVYRSASNGGIKLPATPNQVPVTTMPPAEKARYYLEEAARSIALARYWADVAEMQEEKVQG